MTIFKTTFLASVAISALSVGALTAQAEEGDFLGGDISANVTILNDYRFRGVSLNDEGFALQGGLDWAHESGFYVGTWASNISDFGGSTIETNLYGGYSTEVNGLTLDVGGLLYHYPGGENVDYFEMYGSIGVDLGVFSTALGVAYDFSSDNTGNQDDIYFYGDVETEIPNTPISVSVHLGYEDGFFDQKWDWKIGASVSYGGLDFGISYIDTNIDGPGFDAAAVFSVGASF